MNRLQGIAGSRPSGFICLRLVLPAERHRHIQDFRGLCNNVWAGLHKGRRGEHRLQLARRRHQHQQLHEPALVVLQRDYAQRRGAAPLQHGEAPESLSPPASQLCVSISPCVGHMAQQRSNDALEQVFPETLWVTVQLSSSSSSGGLSDYLLSTLLHEHLPWCDALLLAQAHW